ncbi:tetratricopeptide repeat protein [Aquimarina algicola]|uniref:Tetratricopeptide repeat protein n=1 Tax=Aquimarina algicola TaxID=2589995 RepID=A0A504IT44_9FLAO|nr:tetratricopeptide repeat protein [Aquimarina algicola]TPN81647.1 tetratricopeptide repeat protein [Aquimarina algicola]
MSTKNSRINYEEMFQKISFQKILIVITIVTIIVFSPIFIGSEFLAYDDNWYIYENKNVINFSWDSIVNMFSSPLAGQYSPLGELYNFILYFLFGENATAFKIVALFVHLLNVFLLFNILKNLFQDKVLVSVVTLFFAIHPLQVETIGWLSVMYRNTVFFMFLGYFFYFKYLNDNYKKYKLIPVVVCYVVAFLFKEQAILFPVGLFLINMHKFDYKWNKRIIVEMLFWGVITLAFGLVTIQITQTGGPSITGMKIPLLEKIQLFINTIFDYTYNYLFPNKLSFSYLYALSQSGKSVFKLTFTIIILCLGIFLSFKNKVFRFGFIWLFGFLSLSLSFSFLGMRLTYMADRYVYVPIIGYSIVLYSLILFIHNKFPKRNLHLWISLVFAISFAIFSFNRVSVFRNTKNLWSNVIDVNPNDHYAHNNLGYYYKTNNEIDKATFHYKRAIEIDATNYLAHNNLGDIYALEKQYGKAILHYSKSIKKKPQYKIAYINRANAARKIKNSELLISDLRKIIGFNPKNTKLRTVLIKDLFENKRYREVVKEAKEILKYDQSNNEINSYLGRSYVYLKEYKNAKIFISREIENNKNNGYYLYLRSVCYYQLGDLENAFRDIARAQKIGYAVDKNYLNLMVSEAKKSGIIK